MARNINDMNSNSLIMQWNRDVNGNPISMLIQNEEQQISVTHNLIQLAQVPDQYYRVDIKLKMEDGITVPLIEIYDERDLGDMTFIVDYGTGLVYFGSALAGKTVVAEYYGRGVILISDKRVFHTTGEGFVTTLDEVLEGGKDALALLEHTGGLAGAIELLDQKANEGNTVANRLEDFITETEFYGYTVVLSREAFVVKSSEEGDVDYEEIESVTSDAIVYKGAKQITPTLSIESQTNCTFEVDGQKVSLKTIAKDCIKAQATIGINCGDGLIAYRVLEVTKVFDGINPYQVEISNPFFSFDADANGRIREIQSVTCNFKVTKANEEYRGYTVIIDNLPEGLSCNAIGENEDLQSATFTATLGTALPNNGIVTINFKMGGDITISKSFAYGKSKQGITAQFLSLVGQQILKYNTPDYSDIPTPSRSVITAVTSGLSGTPIWKVGNGTTWIELPYSSTEISFYHNDVVIWGDKTETIIRCELDGMADELTLFKIARGAEGYTVMLTNESSMVQINDDNTVPQTEIEKQKTSIVVYRGDKVLIPDSIYVPESGLYSVTITGSQVQLKAISNSIDTIVIPITITIGDKVFEKEWTIAKARRGVSGEAGSVYTLNVEGGTRSVVYNQLNTNPRPSTSLTFSAKLYKNGEDVTALVSAWIWKAEGVFSGNSGVNTFTPIISDVYSEANLNNIVSVEAICDGNRISYIIPIVVTQDVSGLDWVKDWDDRRVSIRDTEVLTPKLFAGSYDEDIDSITGVAIGTDVLNDGQTTGIVAYQNNKVSFLLDTDGSLVVGNPYDEDGAGLVYSEGNFILNVKDLSIAGVAVPTWDEMVSTVENNGSNITNSLQANMDSINQNLNELSSYIDTSLQDNVITEIEKAELDALFEAITQEVLAIQSQYHVVIDNQFLTDMEQVETLKTYYTNYMLAYDEMAVLYDSIFGDKEVEEIESVPWEEEYLAAEDFSLENIEQLDVDEVLSEELLEEEVEVVEGSATLDTETADSGSILVKFKDHLEVLKSCSELLCAAISEALISISENQTTFMVEQAKEEIRVEIADVDTALLNLENTMNGDFKAGIIKLQNKAILEERLKQLDIEKKDIDGQYEVLISNVSLPIEDKDSLTLAKTELDTVHDLLITKINQAILDNLMTSKELEDINNLIGEYASYLQRYSVVAQECNVTIAENTAKLVIEQTLTDEEIFNKVTNYGEIQGLFIKDEKVYINSEYINTRNFKAVTDDGRETFKIDENGEVHISASSLSITGQSNLATQDYVNSRIESVTNTNVTFTLSNEFQVIPTDEAYYPLSEQTFTLDVKGYLGSAEEIKDFIIGTVKSSLGVIATVSNVNKTVTITVSPSTPLGGVSGYLDIPITYGDREYNKRWSWAVSRQGNQATYVAITGEQFFKYTNNYTGTPTPNSITLTANTFNTSNNGKWQYFDESSNTWIDWSKNGNVVTDKKLTITPTDATLPTLMRVLVRYYVDSVFDTYTVASISDGYNGTDGVDGQDIHFYIRYSENANGYPMTLEPQENTKYMGVCSTSEDIAPSSYLSYTWSLIKGQDGIVGKDGNSSYLHIKYSNDGVTFTENNGEVVGSYIGTYVDFVEADSTVFSDYNWKKFVGEDGVSIVSIEEKYYLSSYQNSLVDGEWLDTAPVWEIGKYVWTKTIFTYSNGTIKETNPICISGKDGMEGTSVLSVDVFYYQSNSATYLIGGSWATEAPTWTNGKYVWTKTVTTLTDGSIKETNPVCITGEKGNSGAGAKSIKIIGSSQIFKSSDGGVTYLPETITLTTVTQNVEYGNWKYSADGGVSWSDIVSGQNGLTISNKNLIISKDTDLFTNDMTSIVFRLNSNSSTIYDTMTISKIKDVEDLHVGVANLYKQTKVINPSNWNYIDGWVIEDEKYKGFTVLSRTGTWMGVYQDGIELLLGERYTLSAYVQGDGVATLYASVQNADINYYNGFSQNEIAPTDWTRVSFTFTPTESGVTNTVTPRFENSVENGSLKICALKLEKGSLATDWSPNTDDLENAYTVILTNEAQVIPTNSEGKPLQSETYETQIQVYQGTSPRTDFVIDNISSKDGITVEQTNNTIKFYVNPSNTIPNSGNFNISITIDEKTFNKVFSWSCSKSGKDGEDNYTILLSNENHTFTSNYLGATAEQTTYTDIIAYKGTTLVNPTIGNLPTVEGLTLSNSGNRVTIKANYGTTLADNGSFDIPITLDGKEFVKSFSWSKVKDGSIGADGANAKNVGIVASNLVFKSTDGGTTFSPNNIKLTAQYQNLTHSRWQYSVDGGTTWINIYDGNNSGWQGGITATSDSLTITIPKTCTFFTDTTTSVVFKVISTDESFYDVITITKLYDVADVDFEGIAEDIAQDKVDALDNRLNQQAVFDRLTNNGKSQGIYLENEQLYINGEYIEANTIKVDQLEIGSITMFVEDKVQTGIDNTNIGARNYLANTGSPIMVMGNGSTNQTTTLYYFVDKDNSPIIGNEATLTFKYEIEEGSTGSFKIQTNGVKIGDATQSNWLELYRVSDVSTVELKGKGTYTRTYKESELHTFTGIGLRLDNFNGLITIYECSMVVGNKSVGWTPAPEDVSDEIQDKVDKLDKSLTQSNVFNRLTNNGAIQGLFMENGALYVNGEYINSKNFKATDNNGNQTFLIDSNGNVSINAKSLALSGQGVTTQDEVLKLISEYNENENLVIEPNFNNGLGNWSLSSSTDIMINTTYTHDGNKAIRFKYTGTKSCSMWTDSFNVTEITQGNTYTAKMYCYVENNSTISGNIKYGIYGTPIGDTSLTLIGETVLTSINFANGKWVEITFDFTPSQTYTSPRLHVNSSSSATIWFCDFALSITKVGYTQKQLVDVLNGIGDGLYIVDGKLLINSEYINARGLSVTNNNGVKTFEIDDNGNVKIVADSFSVSSGGSGNVVTKNELQESISNTKEYVDSTINASSAVNILMSNPVQVIATNVSYYPLSSATYTTTLQVFQGVKEITDYTIGKISNAHGITVTQTNNSISFTVNKTTKISESGSFDVNVTVNGITYKQKFSFTSAKQGDAGTAGSSYSVNIIASSNIFKSGDGGLTFSPSTITLTPVYQNLTHANWLYSIDGGTTWVNVYNANTGACVGGITSTNHILTIPKGCTLFTDEITSIAFKVLATDENYYDIVTVVRLYDTAQLEVGGTNLIPDSTNDLETWGSVTSGYLGHNAILLERSTTGNSSRTFRTKYITDEVSVKTGETYTLSAMVYVDSKITLNKDNNNIYMRLNFDNGNYKDFCVCQLPTTVQKDTWIKVSKTEKLNFSSNIDSIVLQIALQDAGSIKTSMIQLERGNVATDWKPSPKDSFNTKEVSSLINQTKESIELSVSSKYTTQDAFNSLSVGGRNFAQNTSSDWLGFGFTNVTSTNYVYNRNVLIDGEVGDVLTYRLELRLTDMQVVSGQTNGKVRLEGSGNVTAWNSGALYGSSYTIQPGDSNIVITGKITLDENHLKNSYWKTQLRLDNVASGNVEIRNYMFEKGTLNSSWSPAPEDVLNSISTAKQEAIDNAVATSTTNMNSRLNSYSTTTDVKAMIDISKTNIISSVSETYETKANATTKYNGLTSSINTLSTRMNTAEQKITSDAIINTVSGTYATKTEVQNIQVGGVNRIPNSAPTSTSGWSSHTTGWTRSLVDCATAPQGKAIRASLSTTLSTGGMYKSSITTGTWEHGEQYTISCYMRASANAVIGLGHDAFTNTNGLNKNVTTEWQHFTTTGTYNQNASYKACTFYIKSSQSAGFWFEVHSLKVEKGNKPTDWSPAPEDTINSITSLETRVSTAEQKITEDAIISTVSSTYVKKTDFDNMTIGGENLIVNSNFEYGFEKWSGNTTQFELVNDNYYSLKYTKTDLTEAKNYQIRTEPITVLDLVGKELTLTFDYKIIDKSIQTNTTIGYIRFFDADHESSTSQADSMSATNVYYPSNYTNNTRATAKKTVTVPTGAKYVRVGVYQNQNGDIRYSKFQLEVGNKPTTWKASSQDALLYADQTTSSINGELQDLTALVSLNNGSDALTPQLKVKLVAEYKDAKSLYDNLSDMYKKVGITDFAHLVTAMDNAHTSLKTAISNMEQSVNATDESGLSAVLNKFNVFYESADALNQAIINGLKGVTDSLSTSIEQLTKEVNIQISSFNTQLGQITTRFTFGTDGLTIKSTANATKYIKLDNDSLDFMDNGQKVAEITNQQLNISKATITNEMKIGNMKIKPSGIGGVIFVFE